MAISFIGSVIDHGASVTDTTPDFSGLSWQVGDLAIVFCASGQATGIEWTAPDSSWFQKINYDTPTGGDQSLATVFYKFLESGEDETPTFTSTAATRKSTVLAIWRGVSLTNPFDNFVAPMVRQLNDATPTPSPITTLKDNSMVVLWQFSYLSTAWTAGAPSGYTLQANYSGATYDDRQQFIATKILSSAGTETPGDWTHSADPGTNEEGMVWTFALREEETGTNYPEVLDFVESKTAVGVTATSHDIDIPAVDEDDWLAVFIAVSATGISITSEPSGYTKLDPGSTGLANVRLFVGIRQADGTEGSTINIQTNNASTMAAQVYRILDPLADPTYVEDVGGDPPEITSDYEEEDLFITMGITLGGAGQVPPPGFNWPRTTWGGQGTLRPISVVTARKEHEGTQDPDYWRDGFGGIDEIGGGASALAGIMAIRGSTPPPSSGVFGGWGIPIRIAS